ncbi:MAG: putative addiction module antidote protein [Alphaproteobacteria bacterium]|nr:putative addiction module antidote protein [Alphaproteobacteria bacterium]
MPTKTTRWDSAKYLETKEDIAAYLEAAFEDGDLALITQALGAVARAKGMSEIAEKTGLTRPSLYKALCEDGNPEFATVMKVMKALGLDMKVVATAA